MSLQKLAFSTLVFIALMGLSSCYYRPFVGYTMNKKGFKNFNSKERLAGDNSNPHRDYKVNRYDWKVEILPDDKYIKGQMAIHFTSLSDQNVFLFDLQSKMKIKDFQCDFGNPEIKRKNDFLYLEFDDPVPANTRIKLEINYEGKPANVAGEGPVQWRKDAQDRHWISSITEGIGPQFIMPCNALLRAEADSATIDVTVPSEFVAVSNGKLIEVVENQGTKTYKHVINNRINTYSLSFNIGHFLPIQKSYTDINGVARSIECQVMDYNFSKADSFYNQAPVIMGVFENLYGEYPFWEDGCKFIESTFSAMEHQSGIAMGNDYRLNWNEYNLTLVHELSHEWWGNSLTGYDYCDIWIHEGMATLSEALFLERAYSFDDYNHRMRVATKSVFNTIPILKECGVLYNSWVTGQDQDIYSKGALMMNSMRVLLDNDSLFFEALKIIPQKFKGKNISTDEIIIEFNTLLGKDFSEMFDYYLKNTKPPILEIVTNKEDHSFNYRWKEALAFYPDGKIWIKKGETIISLVPSSEFQTYSIGESASLEFLIERSPYYVLELKK